MLNDLPFGVIIFADAAEGTQWCILGVLGDGATRRLRLRYVAFVIDAMRGTEAAFIRLDSTRPFDTISIIARFFGRTGLVWPKTTAANHMKTYLWSPATRYICSPIALNCIV